jgi:alkanesulfonate monooxygenase SsuD/methylene tetrahydromethanopterin reductase-like flavin-dependent oxidoreductase (luciferase family)
VSRTSLQFGLFLPNFGAGFGTPAAVAELAQEAERAGWDGFFLWDHVAPGLDVPVVDPWIGLAAVAVATERLRIGALVTPLPRRRPWDVARQTVALDHLSKGRLVFGAGIGSGRPSEWEGLGEETDPRERAALLDEGLAILAGLWSGEDFRYEGSHFRVARTRFLPTPIQRPRIPVWLASYWPNRRPLRRAARWDGVFPLFRGVPIDDEASCLAEVVATVRAHRESDAFFDVVHCGAPSVGAAGTRRAERVARVAEAGATWWLERLTPEDFGGDWKTRWPAQAILDQVRAGPPGSA